MLYEEKQNRPLTMYHQTDHLYFLLNNNPPYLYLRTDGGSTAFLHIDSSLSRRSTMIFSINVSTRSRVSGNYYRLTSSAALYEPYKEKLKGMAT